METQLRPGDIINISAPGNELLDGQDFIISFVGPGRLTLNSEEGAPTHLDLNDRGELVDKSIRHIELVSREDEESFAKQNGLVPGEYVELELSDGSSVRGEVTASEEDQITIKLADGTDIYIDFEYRGLDVRTGITAISIIPAPSSDTSHPASVPAEVFEAEEDKAVVLDSRDVVFGPALEEVSMLVDVPESEKKYSLARQQNDLLNELLATIPTGERTPHTMASIQNMVQSFSILREQFSHTDQAGLVLGPSRGPDKTLVKHITTAAGSLHWIMPVTSNTKKVYPGAQDETAATFFEDIVVRTQAGLMEDLGIAMDIYNRGTSLDADNAFATMMRTISNIWQPFISEGTGAFPVAESTSAIVGNQPDQTSTVFSKNTVSSHRFFTELYITGDTMLETTRAKGGDSTTVRKKIVQNEPIDIGSLLVLPRPMIRYSNAFFRDAGILTKVNLSRVPVSLWRILQPRSLVQANYVSLTNESGLSVSSKRIQSYSPEGVEGFKEFVEAFVPSPSGMFTEYGEPGYSVFSCILNLRPFLLNTANVDAECTALMALAVNERITTWMTKKADRTLSYNKVISNLRLHPAGFRWATLGVNPTTIQFLEENYGLDFQESYISLDNGRLFTAALALDSSHLVNPVESEHSGAPEFAACAVGMLAKTYATRRAMLADLNRPLKFDKEHDKTYYDTLAEYAAILDNVPRFEDKKTALQKELEQRTGMSKAQAGREAESLLLGYRIVDTGDYALVADNQVYQWSGIAWKLVPGLSKNDIVGETTRACNLQEGCLVVNNECVPTTATLPTKDVIGIFAATDKELKGRRDTAYDRIRPLRALATWKAGAQGRMMRELAGSAVILDEQPSPYAYVLDLILEQGDFAIRQRYIVQFVSFYTRPALPGDSEAWLYCVSSGVGLLPVFLAELAAVYVRGDNYADALDRIVAERGTLGGDGAAVVDKNTGWVITNIDMSAEEGFTDQGFVIRTRAILKADIADAQPTQQPTAYTDKQTQAISIVLAALADFTGINVSTFLEALVSNVTLLLDNTMPTRSEYDTAVAKLKTKKDTYDKALSQTIILYTASYFLLYVQTLPYLPRNTRVFPGCRRTFAGYPVGVTTDKSGLEFIACILSKIRSEERPWDAVNRLKQSTIVKKLSKIIDRYIINTELANQLVQSANTTTQASIHTTPDARYRWLNFLPPPDPVSLGGSFDLNMLRDELTASLRKGTADQFTVIEAMRTQQMRFAIEVEVSIQRAMETDLSQSKHMLTTAAGVPYLENACCSTESPDTNAFFTAREPSIPRVCDESATVRRMLDIAGRRGRASIIFDPTDTQLRYPSLPLEFTKDVIYRAFLVYCSQNANEYEDDQLNRACLGLKRNPLLSLAEEAAELQKQDVRLDNLMLARLMSTVNARNIVYIPIRLPTDAGIGTIEEVLNSHGDSIDTDFLDGLQSLLQRPSDKEAARGLKALLPVLTQRSIARITGLCDKWLDKKTAIGAARCLEFIANTENGSSPMLQHLRNCTESLGRILPNIVLNQSKFVDSPTIPEHWGLSGFHANDIRVMVTKLFAPVKPLYGDKQLNEILSVGQSNNLVWVRLAFSTRQNMLSEAGESPFDYRLTALLQAYYAVMTLESYLSVAEEADEGTDTRPTNPLLNISNDVSLELQSATSEELMRTLAGCLCAFLEIVCSSNKVALLEHEDIMERSVRGKEKEKDLIVKYLTDMSDEEREVENMFKGHSLGRWSVGMQKGFKSYEGAMYDSERHDMERQAMVEQEEGVVDAVTAGLRELYPSTLDMTSIVEQEVKEELESYQGEDTNITDEAYDEEM